MAKTFLNPDNYLPTIRRLEDEIKYTSSKVEEQESLITKCKKENKRNFIGILTVLIFLGIIVFAVVYEPIRNYFLNLFQIDTANFAINKLDFWKVVAIGVSVVVIEAIIVSVAKKENFFETIGLMLLTGVFSAGVFIIPSGIYFCFLNISICNDNKKKAKKELFELTKTLNLKQQRLDSQKRMQAIEAEKLAETDDMFERGVEGELQLVIEAAKLGNPKAVKYLENREKNERLNKGKLLYTQAKNSTPTDMELMEEAANLGDPNAVFEIAEYLFEQTNTDLLTNSEKRKLEQKADKYLQNAKFKKHPDGRILQIKRSIVNSEILDYYKLLSETRKLKREGKISEKYIEMADDIIRILVSQIDYEGKHNSIHVADYNISNLAEFTKNTQAIIDKQLGINRSSAPDGAFVPRIDVSDM